MTKKWAEVESSQEYQALPIEEKQAAKNEYFDSVVAPQVPVHDLDFAKNEFFGSDKPIKKEKPKENNQDNSISGKYKKSISDYVKNTDLGSFKDQPIVGAAETALNAATGIGSTALGGLKGAYTLADSLIHGKGKDQSLQDATDKIHETQENNTWKPRGSGGKLASELLGTTSEIPGKVLGYVGGKSGSLISPKAEAAGEAIGETLGQIAPILMDSKPSSFKMGDAPEFSKKPTPKFGEVARELLPDQKERLERMESQGLSPTLGNVTRDPVQTRFEEQISGREQGSPIYERRVNQNQKLTEGVDSHLNGKQSLGEVETGRSIRSGIESASDKKWKEVGENYKKARESGETSQVVDMSPLEKFLSDKKSDSISVPELKAIKSALSELKKDKTNNEKTVSILDSNGNPIKPKAENKPNITIDDIEFLRQKANDLSNPENKSGHYMSQVKKVIDKITEGKGGDLYKKAQKSRYDYAQEFEEPRGTSQVLDKRSRTDYKTSDEDVFRKTVVSGSKNDLASVIDTLKKHDPSKIGDIKSQTIDYIKEKSTSGIGLDQRGNASFSPSAFSKSMKDIGKEKLELLLGKETTRKLEDLLKSSREIKTQPGSVSNSTTSLNLMSELDRLAKGASVKAASSIPVVGKAISPLVDVYKSYQDKIKTQQAIDESLNPRFASHETVKNEAKKVKSENKRSNSERKKYLLGEALKRTGSATASSMAAQKPKEQEDQ